MDAQQSAAYTQQQSIISGNRNSWVGILTVAIAMSAFILASFGGILTLTMSPVRETIALLTQGVNQSQTKEQADKDQKDNNQWLNNLAARVETKMPLETHITYRAEMDSRLKTEHDSLIREFDRINKELEKNALLFVPRSEIEQISRDFQNELDRMRKDNDRIDLEAHAREAAIALQGNERVNTIVGSLNELRHDFGNAFTWGDIIKDLQTQLRELRSITPAITGK